MIMVLLAGASVFSKFLGVVGFVNMLTQSVIHMQLSPIWLFIVIYVIFMFFGCFVDSTSLMLLLVPIFFPIIVKLGYDPIWFGMIVLMLIQIGQIVPPVGMAVYVLAHVSGNTPETCFGVARSIILLYVFGLILFSIFPGLTLWLVHQMWAPT
jgi:TRAP-type C4-dicarboxylate transport system permease large subunit